jgi:hypothetical protein
VKKLRYLGPHSGVLIPLASGFVYECDRDGTVDLPDDLAKEFLVRDEWELVSKSKSTKKPEEAKESK